jgi:hypothetical protein
VVIYDSREEVYQGLNRIKQMRPLPALILLARNFRSVFKALEPDRWTKSSRKAVISPVSALYGI